MPYTFRDLLNEADGTVNREVLASMCRGYANREYGGCSPYALRQAEKWYMQHYADLKTDWCSRHGQMMVRVTVYPLLTSSERRLTRMINAENMGLTPAEARDLIGGEA